MVYTKCEGNPWEFQHALVVADIGNKKKKIRMSLSWETIVLIEDKLNQDTILRKSNQISRYWSAKLVGTFQGCGVKGM